MKKLIILFLVSVFCAPFGIARVNFAERPAVRQFQPIDGKMSPRIGEPAAPSSSTTSSATSKPNSTVPPNVIPLGIEVRMDGTGSMNACSAFRLTSTLVLTAAHCLVDEFPHGSRVNTEVSQLADGQWLLKVIFDHSQPGVAKPNAQIAYYRPGYRADGTDMSHAFDFVVIKLDQSLQFNQAGVNAELKKLEGQLAQVSADMKDALVAQATSKARQEFNKQAAAYKQFLQVPLETYDLLEMSPDVVAAELQNRTILAYFWPGMENSMDRGNVEVLAGGYAGQAPKSTHTLLFSTHAKPGTSGSPFLDTQRKLLVSVDSGPMGGNDSGGLISEQVCLWVKSHDARVKCLVASGGKQYQETEIATAWGR